MYQVELVTEAELPDRDWLLLRRDGAVHPVLFIRESVANCPKVAAEVRAARAMMGAPRMPDQRRPIALRVVMSAGLLAASCAEGASLLFSWNPDIIT